jgi:hypothetical protein
MLKGQEQLAHGLPQDGSKLIVLNLCDGVDQLLALEAGFLARDRGPCPLSAGRGWSWRAKHAISLDHGIPVLRLRSGLSRCSQHRGGPLVFQA